MKAAYPVILSQGNTHIVVTIPDFQANTQGKDLAEAIEMARDCIGLLGMDMEDEKETIPAPSSLQTVAKQNSDDIVTLVDVDFDVYRRKIDLRAVKKNCTIPSWLNEEAEKAGINFSQVLQEALKERLGV